MQLNEAVQIVQQKFMVESQGKVDGPELDAYTDAFEKFPVMMEVATQCWSDQIIQQNYEARKQQAIKAAQEQAQEAQGENAAPQGTA